MDKASVLFLLLCILEESYTTKQGNHALTLVLASKVDFVFKINEQQF